MTRETIEIDEFSMPTANVLYDVECVPADPDVGIFHGYHEVRARVTGWNVGNLKLQRADLVVALGIDAVEAFEAREAEAHAESLADGGPDCDDRFDAAQDAAR